MAPSRCVYICLLVVLRGVLALPARPNQPAWQHLSSSPKNNPHLQHHHPNQRGAGDPAVEVDPHLLVDGKLVPLVAAEAESVGGGYTLDSNRGESVQHTVRPVA